MAALRNLHGYHPLDLATPHADCIGSSAQEKTLLYFPIAVHTVQILIFVSIFAWASKTKKSGGVTNVFSLLMVVSSIFDIAYHATSHIDFVSAFGFPFLML